MIRKLALNGLREIKNLGYNFNQKLYKKLQSKTYQKLFLYVLYKVFFSEKFVNIYPDEES